MNKFRKPHGSGRDGGGRFGDRPSRPGSDRPRFGGPSRPRFGGSRREGVELFDAVCSKCGKDCKVPFRPNGQKPVYCRECFGMPSKDSSRREEFVRRDVPVAPFEPRRENRELIDLKQQMSAMNSKLDNILRMVQTLPRVSAPVAVALPSTSEAAPKELPKKKSAKKKSASKK